MKEDVFIPDHSEPPVFAPESATRKGDIVGRKYDSRALQHHPVSQLYHCLNYPCKNLTTWFYRPANSHLCDDCMAEQEVARAQNEASQ